MENLDEKEIERAKDIISSGLKRAAESLSFFMKETINLRETDFNISSTYESSSHAESSEEKLFVLSTELKGQLKGVCYLVFNEEEVKEVCKVALPPQILNEPEKLKGMQEPLLLEVDNIISASVITEIANQLTLKVYGDVPGLKLMSENELKNTIIQQMKPDKLVIGFQTEFISSKLNFHPGFFWILEPEFMICVKETLLHKTER